MSKGLLLLLCFATIATSDSAVFFVKDGEVPLEHCKEDSLVCGCFVKQVSQYRSKVECISFGTRVENKDLTGRSGTQRYIDGDPCKGTKRWSAVVETTDAKQNDDEYCAYLTNECSIWLTPCSSGRDTLVTNFTMDNSLVDFPLNITQDTNTWDVLMSAERVTVKVAFKSDRFYLSGYTKSSIYNISILSLVGTQNVYTQFSDIADPLSGWVLLLATAIALSLFTKSMWKYLRYKNYQTVLGKRGYKRIKDKEV